MLSGTSHRPATPADTQFNSIVGSGKEVLGNAIEQVYAAVGGSKEPSQFTVDGKEQHAKGEAEIKAAEAKGYAEGMGDRVGLPDRLSVFWPQN